MLPVLPAAKQWKNQSLQRWTFDLYYTGLWYDSLSVSHTLLPVFHWDSFLLSLADISLLLAKSLTSVSTTKRSGKCTFLGRIYFCCYYYWSVRLFQCCRICGFFIPKLIWSQHDALTDAVYVATALRRVMHRGQMGVAVNAERLAERSESHVSLKNFWSGKKCV